MNSNNVKLVVAVGNELIYNNYIKTFIDNKSRQSIPACIINNDPNIHEDIFMKYNKGMYALKNHQNVGINDEDVIIFIHEDVKVEDPNFVAKIATVFDLKRDIGVVGVVGSREINESCAWYLQNDGSFKKDNNTLCGHLMQEVNGNPYHSVFGNQIGFYDDLVAVDGCCIAVRGKLINEGLAFDTNNFKGFHFYDLDICLEALNLGYKVAVIDTLIRHKSEGKGISSNEWKINKEIFISKWKSRGKTFPITSSQFTIREIEEKINNEVTVIEI